MSESLDSSGTATPLSREAVLEVVKKHIFWTLDGLDPATFDPAKSLRDYGALSLDIVSIVSASMRELKVKVPRQELAKLTNINGLVDLLWRFGAPPAP